MCSQGYMQHAHTPGRLRPPSTHTHTHQHQQRSMCSTRPTHRMCCQTSPTVCATSRALEICARACVYVCVRVYASVCVCVRVLGGGRASHGDTFPQRYGGPHLVGSDDALVVKAQGVGGHHILPCTDHVAVLDPLQGDMHLPASDQGPQCGSSVHDTCARELAPEAVREGGGGRGGGGQGREGKGVPVSNAARTALPPLATPTHHLHSDSPQDCMAALEHFVMLLDAPNYNCYPKQ